MEQITRTITVKCDADRLYQLWASFESFPRFLPDLRSVIKTGPRTSRWIVAGPLGKEVSWVAETTTEQPGKRLAWNTIAGEVKTSGQVVFSEMDDGYTQVTVTINWTPPGGIVGELLAKALKDPDDMLGRALRAIKQEAEEGVWMGSAEEETAEQSRSGAVKGPA